MNNNLNAQSQVHIEGNGSSEIELFMENTQISPNSHTQLRAENASSQATTAVIFEGRKSRGSTSSPTQIEPGDRILSLIGAQYVNDAYRSSSSVGFFAGRNISQGSHASFISFKTTGNGELSRSERMRISEDGLIGINTPDPKARVHVSDGDVYIEDINNGIIMKSPNGTCWRTTIDDAGNMVSAALASCP